MAFYDNLGKKLTEAKDEAVQKTKNYTEVMRLSSSVSDMEREITSLYTEIGRNYYKKYAGLPEKADPEAMQPLLAISEKLKEIENCRKEIRKLKGLRLCDNCGKEISQDVAFCNFCGARQIPEVTIPEGDHICPQCGAAYEETQMFCMNCGYDLRNIQKEAPENKEEPQKRTCRYCGAEVEEGMVFCMNCGHKVEEEKPESADIPAPHEEISENAGEALQEMTEEDSPVNTDSEGNI